MRHFLGWNVGGTNSSAVVVTERGEILARSVWPSGAIRGPEKMLGDFLRKAEEMRREFKTIEGVGVSIGGPLDPLRGIVYSPPHLPGWDEWPLGEILTGKLELPAMVEHDAVACLLAEHLWGCAQGASHAAYLTAGTGCGAGILTDGRVVRGPLGQSSEIGHLRLAEEGPNVYGKAGSVESFCSGTGISLLATHMFPKDFPPPVSAREIALRAAQGESNAKAVLLKSARMMGRVCALLSDLFSSQIIIIGSLAAYLPDWWMDGVREEWEKESLGWQRTKAQVRGASLGKNLQALSAVASCIFRPEAQPIPTP